MSTQVYTLEQVCKEFYTTIFEPDTISKLNASAVVLHDTQNGSYPGAVLRLQDVLRHLVTTLTLPLTLDEMLHLLATLTMQAMRVDLCVILLKEPTQNALWVYTWSPDLSEKGVIVQSVTVGDTLIERLRSFAEQSHLPRLSTQELDTLNPLQNVQFEGLYPIPLFAGTDCIGLMNCYASRVIKYSEEEELTATLIASQVALAIKHRQCVAEDAHAQQTLIKAFVDDLFSGKPEKEEALRRRANFLGYDLTRAHAVTLIELAEIETAETERQRAQTRLVSREERLILYHSVTRKIKQQIQEHAPGSLIDERDNMLICLLCLDEQSALNTHTQWLDRLISQLWHEHHVCISAGIGNPCESVNEYRRGLAEAQEALEIGQSLPQEGTCMHFQALGAYRYIYNFAQANTLQDQYQNQIDTIVDYDRRKKTNLLDTLETYLECGGNVAKTSTQLEVHRNTLLQRLDRLQKLCTIDVEQIANRLPLLIALKIHRLHAQRKEHD